MCHRIGPAGDRCDLTDGRCGVASRRAPVTRQLSWCVVNRRALAADPGALAASIRRCGRRAPTMGRAARRPGCAAKRCKRATTAEWCADEATGRCSFRRGRRSGRCRCATITSGSAARRANGHAKSTGCSWISGCRSVATAGQASRRAGQYTAGRCRAVEQVRKDGRLVWRLRAAPCQEFGSTASAPTGRGELRRGRRAVAVLFCCIS